MEDDLRTEAFDKIDHAYDEIDMALELEADSSCQSMVVSRQPDVEKPRSTENRSSQCGFAFSPGDRVGKYELHEKIGQGTFGVVHAAHDRELDRCVALKLLHPQHNDNDDVLHRFVQEARAAARIGHPGVVTVLEAGRCTIATGFDVAYIAMERLEGESVGSRLKRCGRFAPATAAEVGRQVAAALAAAHGARVLHRDLKPDNIYLVPDTAAAAGERAKVLDFGLAKLHDATRTAIKDVFGTPRYMSPEQCRSTAQIDERSDIYSLGCILFELVTGRTPFEGEVYKILERHLTVPPPRTRSLVPEVPAGLDALVHRMLAKDPAERPQTMAEVEAELRHAGAMSPGAADTILPGTLRPLEPALFDEAAHTHDVAPPSPSPSYEDYHYQPIATPYDPANDPLYDPMVAAEALRRTRRHTPNTPTHVIRPLQKRRNPLGPVIALAITIAIGIALGLIASSHVQNTAASVSTKR